MRSRRGVLKLIGGGVVLAAGGAAAFVGFNQPSHAARAAWREAGAPSEYRKRALSYALLAPNPHNRQPWSVRLEGTDALTLFVDLDRRLPHTDPFDRQILIGCGAFLELLTIAVAQDGYTCEIVTFPEGEPRPRLDQRPVATVRFVANSAKPDPAFSTILKRHTNRQAYEPRDVNPAALAALTVSGSVYGTQANVIGNTSIAAALRDLTWRAHVQEVTTYRTNKESIDLMRIGAEQVGKYRDGISLEGPLIAAGAVAGIVTKKELLDVDSRAFKMGVDMYKAAAASPRAYAWLLNNGETRVDELNAGRAYARLALKAAELGLAIHPWSQSLQEFPEMAQLYREVHELIGDGRRIQMMVRVGYADPVIAAPRRGLAAHIT